jgi:hypothetical protein
MSMTRNMIALAGVLLVAGVASTAALAASTKAQQERGHAAALMKELGAGTNGVVSKDQFMNFMSAEFDRLKTDSSGLTQSQVHEFAHTWEPMPASCYRANPPARCNSPESQALERTPAFRGRPLGQR